MIRKMLSFIHESPVNFFAVENVKNRLEEEGFAELPSSEWELRAGGKYYMTRNGSSLIAFRIPEGEPKGFVISASHSDSPCLKIRDHAELAGPYVRLEAERYGGMINASWVDRPLSIAGRILVRKDGGLKVLLVNLRKDCAVIPNTAPHLMRGINDGVKYDPAKDLIALYGEQASAGSFYEEIAEEAGVHPSDIVSAEQGKRSFRFLRNANEKDLPTTTQEDPALL